MLFKDQKKFSVILYFMSYDQKKDVNSNGLTYLYEESREFNHAFYNLTFCQVVKLINDLSEDAIAQLTNIKIDEEEEEEYEREDDCFPF